MTKKQPFYKLREEVKDKLKIQKKKGRDKITKKKRDLQAKKGSKTIAE